jgi:UDP-N-acetylmuramate-alanine ligase
MLPGDVVITLGAGDVNKLCQTIPEALDAHA